ncbi:class I SAM-dependent methyltransferase [Streptomyces calidiresistens]|uniref:Methyltransferase domain-containing protein n=1 Tax=Streptomyces calidiresistens TaxID=1485586 RepID=A0A7W3XV23_9ACTN|nr:class I SAM-dependent methyltransferase [Streptomyces calidiresistens]MBB0228292.1 methyltransferase domain-containing protein [Streptomyces calidiresistens]
MRAVYDTVAEEYDALLADQLAGQPLDRAVLAAFSDLVREAEAGPVADLGCGTGRVTAHLRDLGVEVFGVDLSPGMVGVARRRYPDLRFEVGSMADTGLPDASLGGILAWYATVHTPPADLPAVFAEFRRLLAPGGRVLLGFKVSGEPGGEVRRLERAHGHAVRLDVRWTHPDRMAALVARAGLPEEARWIREPDATDGPRAGRQGFLLARRPGRGDPPMT